ncbi:hypothetical protein IWX89_001832 [Cryobacterium sp. MP_M3]|nr:MULTISPECIES: hypothetical protein [unclassified Cryobacterium]MBG6058390.1 hypothetical protein [Cryobacterium sp. MP_M3]
MSPPRIIDGMKTSWDNNTVILVFADTTPISAPAPASAKAAAANTRRKPAQLRGAAPPNRAGALAAITRATTSACIMLVSTGITSSDRAGTPLIL